MRIPPLLVLYPGIIPSGRREIKGEEEIKEAVKLAENTRNDSIETWLLMVSFLDFFWLIRLFSTVPPIALANLMIFITHSRYKDLKKMPRLTQFQKNGNAAVLIDI